MIGEEAKPGTDVRNRTAITTIIHNLAQNGQYRPNIKQIPFSRVWTLSYRLSCDPIYRRATLRHAVKREPAFGGIRALPAVAQVDLGELETFIFALVVHFFGRGIRAALPWLRRIDPPDAVVGGLGAALLASSMRLACSIEFAFGAHLRDLLLLVFFSTIGRSAKLFLLLPWFKLG